MHARSTPYRTGSILFNSQKNRCTSRRRLDIRVWKNSAGGGSSTVWLFSHIVLSSYSFWRNNCTFAQRIACARPYCAYVAVIIPKIQVCFISTRLSIIEHNNTRTTSLFVYRVHVQLYASAHCPTSQRARTSVSFCHSSTDRCSTSAKNTSDRGNGSARDFRGRHFFFVRLPGGSIHTRTHTSQSTKFPKLHKI